MTTDAEVLGMTTDEQADVSAAIERLQRDVDLTAGKPQPYGNPPMRVDLVTLLGAYRDLTTRVEAAERERDALRAEIATLTDAWFCDETIQDDGSLRASLPALIRERDAMRAVVEAARDLTPLPCVDNGGFCCHCHELVVPWRPHADNCTGLALWDALAALDGERAE